jgi:protein phosphatase 1 regulatory subunit 7
MRLGAAGMRAQLDPAQPTNPQVLDVSSNRLTAVDNLGSLSRLEDLWLNDNQIPTLDGLDTALASQRESLTTVYLHGNPAAGDPRYKEKLLALLPRLAQLDDKVLPSKT